jgi:hypothetical protein
MSIYSATGTIVRQLNASPSAPPAAGGGDMFRSVYDSDNDGVVNDSERLAGQLASYYASAASVTAALANKADLVGGFIPTSQLPAIAITEFLGTVANQNAMLQLTGQRGDWCNRSDEFKAYVLINENPSLINSWVPINYPAAPVLSVNGQAGTVVLGKADIGLPLIPNLAPADWPISSAAQTAIEAREPAITQGSASEVLNGEKQWVALTPGLVGLDQVPNIDATNADNIQQTSARQFVSGTQISVWNGKQDSIVFPRTNSAAFTGTIAFTAGTQPSGTTDHRISMYRIGSMVSFTITLEYATAGATMTSLTLSNITQLPNPATNSNYAGASMYVQVLNGRIMTTSKSANALVISPMWRVNAAANGFEIITAPTFSTGSYRFVIITGFYLTA